MTSDEIERIRDEIERRMFDRIERLRLAYQIAARAYCAALEEENRRRPRNSRVLVDMVHMSPPVEEYQLTQLRETDK